MKKLLLLAGANVHCKVVEAAHEMGIYTIVTDYLENSPAKKIADESWMLDIKDVDGIVKKCKDNKVNGVLNFCIDPGQKPYQEICERLQLPCIGTREQFEIMTDKTRFKQFCKENGVDTIDSYSLDDITNGQVHYPIFIKPSCSRGSRGQYICYTRDEAINAWNIASSISNDHKALCEKYMKKGWDIATAFFVVDGEPYLVKLGDRILGKEEDHLNRQVMCTLLPSVYANEFDQFVYSKAINMIKTLGIKYGPVFLQGFFDKNTMRFYDPGLRMPGSNYDLLLEKATGFNTVKSMIHFALTGDTKTVFGIPNRNLYRLNGHKALMFTVSVRPGKIGKIIGAKTILNDLRTVYGFSLLDEGMIVAGSGDIQQRVAEFGILLEDKSNIEEYVNYFYNNFSVIDEFGSDMVVSKIIENENIKDYYK